MWEATSVADHLQSLLGSFLVVYIQIQGCIIVLGLALGWVYATQCRVKELRKLRLAEEKGNPLAFLHLDQTKLLHAKQKCLPAVSVILPVKGLGEHSLANWRTQLGSLYGGTLEFTFVVESEVDEAYGAVLELIEDYKESMHLQLVVAGYAAACSQKIHNQLAGLAAMSKEAKYVLFLDDDIRLHPGTIGALVAEAESDPQVFLVTGYPFDIPSGSLLNYCFMEYHLPLFIGFSTGGRTCFVWGGCMLMHAEDWRTNRYNLLTAFRNGGYSDDLLLASIASGNGRTVSCPGVAVFPYPLASHCTISKYWNYLRRQIFVLETYCSLHNRLVNRALFVVHCFLSWGLVLPLVPLALHLVLTLAALVQGLDQILTESSLTPLLDAVAQANKPGALAAWALVPCGYLAFCALSYMGRANIDLCNALSPEREPLSSDALPWHMVALGMIVGESLYPICAVYTFFVPSVTWSGIEYTRCQGKICKVTRQKAPRSFVKDDQSRIGSLLKRLLLVLLMSAGWKRKVPHKVSA